MLCKYMLARNRGRNSRANTSGSFLSFGGEQNNGQAGTSYLRRGHPTRAVGTSRKHAPSTTAEFVNLFPGTIYIIGAAAARINGSRVSPPHLYASSYSLLHH